MSALEEGKGGGRKGGVGFKDWEERGKERGRQIGTRVREGEKEGNNE